MDNHRDRKQGYETKKCPECFTHLPLKAEKCNVCNTRVGGVNKHGTAKKPVDWRGYTICFLAWLVLGIYIWWAFLKE